MAQTITIDGIDVTDNANVHVDWDRTELGNSIADGSSSLGQLVVKGNEQWLVNNIGAAAHKIVEWLVDGIPLARGRVLSVQVERGPLRADRDTQWTFSVGDYNDDLKGLRLTAKAARPEESDVDRVLWALGLLANGSPRASTVLDPAGVIAANEVTMDAKTYPVGTELTEIVDECKDIAGKTYGVMVDGTFLYLIPGDITTYVSALSVSDRPAEVDNDTVWAPDKIGGIPFSSESGDVVSDVIFKYGGGEAFVTSTSPHPADEYWAEVAEDSDIATEAMAQAMADSIVNAHDDDSRTYMYALRKLPAEKLGDIMAGQVISQKARAIPDSDDDATTPRIVELRWQFVPGGEGQWIAIVRAGRPLRLVGYNRTRGKPGPAPEGEGEGPPTTGETLTVYESWDWDGPSAEPIAHPVIPGANAFADGSGTCDVPNNGFGPTAAYACYTRPTVSLNSGEVVAVAGTKYQFSVTHTPYSPTYRVYVEWRNAIGGSLGTTDIVAVGSHGNGWHTATMQDVAPVGTAKMEICADLGSGGFSGVSLFYDTVRIWTVSAGTSTDPADVYGIAPPYAGTSPYYARSDQKWPASSVILGDSAEIGYTDTDADGYISGEEAFRQIRDLVTTSGLPWFNVTTYGATGDGTTDDLTAINAAIAALNAAAKGVLYFPAGDYLISDSLTTISAATALVKGDGMATFNGTTAPTQIKISANNKHIFSFSGHPQKVEDIALVCSSGSTPVSGSAGIIFNTAIAEGHFILDSVSFHRFYIGADIRNSAYSVIDKCVFSDGIKYHLKIQNTVDDDHGDWSISNSSFLSQDFATDAHIRIESSGGGKITNCKLNWRDHLETNAVHGIDLAIGGSTVTGILLISNTSIENVSGDGIHATVASGGIWGGITLSNVQMGLWTNNTGKALNLVASASGGIQDVSVYGCRFHTDGTARTAIQLTNVTRAAIGPVVIDGFNKVLDTTTSTGIRDDTGSVGDEVAISGVPSAGQVPVATSATAATWQTPASGATATSMWRPLMDGAGNVVTDAGTGEAIMAYV